MKTFVMATLLMCLNSGPCEQKQVQIESRACAIGSLDAKVPNDGVFEDAKIHVKCHKS